MNVTTLGVFDSKTIFGIEVGRAGAGGGSDATGVDGGTGGGTEAECVVCLTERKTIVLLPCRHLCVCGACFTQLDKCPVCRSPFHSHLAFVSTPAPTAASTPGAAPAASSSTGNPLHVGRDADEEGGL